MEREHFDQSHRLNERKLTIKRRYTEAHPAKEVGSSARVRNKVLEAIKDGKISKEDFDKIVSELSTDSKRWLKRNSQYFNVSEDGVTLSKSGSRILNQIKTNTQPTMRKLVMESFSEFVNLNENSEIVNEGTRGQFGVIDKKGNIQSVYTHYDSYPEYTLPIIKRHYKNAKQAKEVIAKGDNSGLDKITDMNFYGDDNAPMTGKKSNMEKYIKLAATDGGAEFIYLYDESDKTWYMVDVYGDRELVPAFESVEINESFKSSKLRNLMNMDPAGTTYGSHKGLAKAFYGLTKIKLDTLEDSALVDYSDPKEAFKNLSKNREYVVFYIVDNEKENPYAKGYSKYEYATLRPGLLAMTRGKDFLSSVYDQREVQKARKIGDKSSKRNMVTNDPDGAVGGNKKYSGYSASGISSVKRAAELADRAIAINIEYSGESSKEDRSNRLKAREGAIAFKSAKDFKKANLTRYQEILANKAAALPLDKIVEDSINLLTKHISDAIKSGEKTQYGEFKIGEDKRGREIKVTDASNIMNNMLSDYERYTRYMADAERDKKDGFSTGYYERESKDYAKKIKDRAKKIKDLDYAW